jgi:MATE family multidrug resistance protein
MLFWSRIRREFPPLFRLAIPLVAGELGWMLMSVVDTMMVGRLSTEAIGAVSIGSGLFYAVAVTGMGMVLGLDSVVSQAFGARRFLDCHRALRDALWIAA